MVADSVAAPEDGTEAVGVENGTELAETGDGIGLAEAEDGVHAGSVHYGSDSQEMNAPSEVEQATQAYYHVFGGEEILVGSLASVAAEFLGSLPPTVERARTGHCSVLPERGKNVRSGHAETGVVPNAGTVGYDEGDDDGGVGDDEVLNATEAEDAATATAYTEAEPGEHTGYAGDCVLYENQTRGELMIAQALGM